VRRELAGALPPPEPEGGIVGWMRANLFSTPFNGVLTIACLLFFLWIIRPLADFMLIDAVWTGTDREACLVTAERPEVGACWPFVWEWFSYFVYGFYPRAERWRVDVFFALLAVGIVWLLRFRTRRRDLAALYFFVVLPVLSYVLLSGFPAIGLVRVDTVLWGGILVTVVVATVGIVASLPLGILLALGRRSEMPVVRLFSIIFIEFVRGVPLITVLFMASVMLPLFVPEAWTPDKLLRALIGVALFASAYMAEVVRAGLQAVPRGQYEAARALSLGYWRMTVLIVLPQALRYTFPNIVNTYIGLFKDTTLVFIVGVFDFLKTIEAARLDPKWASPVTSVTGYAFAAVFYFTCCYAMSRYAARVEALLSRTAPSGRLWPKRLRWIGSQRRAD
jgi:general L-amino acid transport system permease protein